MLPSESGAHWTTTLRESMEAYSQQIRGLLAALSESNDEAEKPVEKKKKKKAGKQYWLSRDVDAKVNRGDLKIPGRRKIRELERAMISAEWNNTPIDYSQIDLNAYENIEEGDDDVYITNENITGEEIFACVLNKSDNTSPIEYLIDHHWRVLFLNEVNISAKKTKIFIERFIDDDSNGDVSLESVSSFISNVNDGEGSDNDTPETETHLQKNALIKYVPKAMKQLPSLLNRSLDYDNDDGELDETIMCKSTQQFVEAIAYGILYQLCALMWKKYDRDDSGSISSKELSKLLKTEAALYCSNDTCQAIVDILDVDGDGEVSLYGLASFLHKVHMVPEDARDEYKARGTSHEALIDFSEVMLSKLVSTRRYDHVSEAVQKRRSEKDAAENDAKKLHQQKMEEETKNAQKRHEEELAKSKLRMEEEEEEYLDAVEMQSTEFDSEAGSRGEGGEKDVQDEVEDGEIVDAQKS